MLVMRACDVRCKMLFDEGVRVGVAHMIRDRVLRDNSWDEDRALPPSVRTAIAAELIASEGKEVARGVGGDINKAVGGGVVLGGESVREAKRLTEKKTFLTTSLHPSCDSPRSPQGCSGASRPGSVPLLGTRSRRARGATRTCSGIPPRSCGWVKRLGRQLRREGQRTGERQQVAKRRAKKLFLETLMGSTGTSICSVPADNSITISNNVNIKHPIRFALIVTGLLF